MCLGKALCGLLLNNICEVFSSQLNDVRDKSIIVCLEYIREYLVKRIVVVQQIIERSVGQLTPTVQAMVDANKEEATDCVVEWIAGSLYKVSVPNEVHCVANMDRKECGCRMWELIGIPCKHVVAAINYMNENGKGAGVPEDWVHAAYSLETWARPELLGEINVGISSENVANETKESDCKGQTSFELIATEDVDAEIEEIKK
ncbi:transposase, mutator type [Artemisia annua]|uniref:Transposase, mutator type n=1 Tax=Artemisia annua TaxID=35608 RepID=A0A2U1KZQ0_ARTAN|nr:transposase, mutator type [Artemisia annua]